MLGWLKSQARKAGGGAKLMLQSLEAREVPAVNFWIGASDDFDNPMYWTDGVPTADDIITFNGLPEVTQDPGDGNGGGPPSPPPPPPSGPQPYSLSNLTFPDVEDENHLPAYAGIRIINGYGGVVTFPANVDFGEYKQTTGSTAQFEDTDLTITSSFLWTGGAVNATSNVATYNIIGATGQIGEDTTDLSSGSKFVTISGADVIQAGILNILNDQGIDVLEGSIFRQQQLINQVNNKPEVKADDKVLAKGEVYSEGGKLPSVLIEGGTLWVKEGGLIVTGKIPGSAWGLKLNTATSKLYMMNGEVLTATEDVLMNAGQLKTFTAPEGTTQVAAIVGILRVDGGSIELGNSFDLQVASFSTLHVSKALHLIGGSFWPKVNGASADRDAIQTGKNIPTSSAFKVEGTVSQNLGDAAGKTWDVLKSVVGFTNEYDQDPTWTGDLEWVQYRSSTSKKWYIHRKGE